MLKLHTFHSLSQPSTFLILKQNLNEVTFVTVYCILVGFLCDMLHKIWVRELSKHVCAKFSGDNYVESSSWELCLSSVSPYYPKYHLKAQFFWNLSATFQWWHCHDDVMPYSFIVCFVYLFLFPSPCLIAQYLMNQSYYHRGNHLSL